MLRVMISVFEYFSFKKFLCDYYEEQKAIHRHFSYAVMAKKVNISSRGLLKLIMDGKRRLSLYNMSSITHGLELNKSESEYFFCLVQFEQAANAEEKNRFYLKLMSFPQKRKVSPLGLEQYNLYSKWYYSVLHELILLKPNSQSMENFYPQVQIAMNSKLTLREIQDAYRNLFDLGLLKYEQGQVRITNHFMTTQDREVINFAIQNFQKEMMKQAEEALAQPLPSREYGTVTLAIRKEEIARAKGVIKDFINKFNLEFSALSGAEAVYQLNLQFFELADGAHFQANPEIKQDLNSAMRPQFIEEPQFGKENSEEL